MKPSYIRLTLFVVLIVLVAALPLSALAQVPMPEGDSAINQPNADPELLPGVHFVHVASAENITSNWTYLDHPLLNGDDSAIFFVTQNWNPQNLDGTYNDKAIGVWYDEFVGKWGIFNQDETAMPEEAAFNVHIPVVDSTRFVHEATAANTVGNHTYIDNALTNNNPEATLFVTQNWNPAGEDGVYNDQVVGVWYDDSEQKWSVFNQNLFAAIPENASFNILVASEDETTMVHTATADNISNHISTIDDPRINNNPNALLTVSQNWNPGGVGGTYNPHAFGIYYFGGYWRIFNQDFADMPENASFNVLIPPSDSAAFTHRATAENSIENYTLVDHPLLNGNPDAIVYVTQNWNPGSSGEVYNDHHIGVWYSYLYQQWSIFNQDQELMPEGAAFNVYVPPIGANAFTHVADTANIDSQVTYIDHPETNGDPDFIALFTPNWNPRGLGGTYNDHAAGIWFDDLNQKASVFNEDLVDMPEESAFNVLIPDDDDIVFTHTATIANSFSNWTTIDHPMLNGNPHALVYITHNWNPGGGLGGVYNDQATGVWYWESAGRWGIFNQNTGVNMPEGVVFNVLVVPHYKIFLPLTVR
jgi:hypothetical protein